ncbi:MAG: biotin-dependent carboxyltransferase family protein [Deltaproteobacteria bacterium]|nr:biotin-dependent carboxyltransferase family protein [Deltaproteobacteria bacterium]
MDAVAALEILSAGPLTSVQDLGRSGYGRYGVALSGALDPYALRIANLLVGNRENDAAIEVTLMGLTARILTDLVVAVTGADLQLCLNRKPLKMWCSHALKKDDILSFRRPLSGCRAYLALGGKIHIPAVMGSKSTNLSAAFGGFNGRPFKDGDILSLEPSATGWLEGESAIDPRQIPVYPRDWLLRVLMGPQDNHFARAVLDTFLNAAFKVSPQSNRVGIRLEGPVIERKAGMQASIISEGVIAGTIQVPGDGQPIIILGETVTGGYRKVATVITADLPLLGQVKPGNHIMFQAVSLESANQALKDVEKNIREIKQRLSA